MATIGITAVAMLNTLRLLAEGARPIDWLMLVVEVLVLLIIGLEGTIYAVRYFKVKNRLSKLKPFMDSGKKLKDSIPYQLTPPTVEMNDWVLAVTTWSDRALEFLGKQSTTVAHSFTLVVNASEVSAAITRPNGDTFSVSGQYRQTYQTLVSQMDNLRRIMEKPDVYF